MSFSDEIDTAYRALESALCSVAQATGRGYTLALIPHAPYEPASISLDGKPVTLSDVAKPERIVALAFADRKRSSTAREIAGPASRVEPVFTS